MKLTFCRLNYLLRAVLLLACCCSVQPALAIDTFSFATPELRERFYRLSDELRCPKCQNQNLSGSNADIAKDLRTEIHRLLHEDKTDAEIKDYMVERYGEFVLYRPRFSRQNLALWLLPPTLLLTGLIALFLLVRRHRVQALAENETELTDAEARALADILLREPAQEHPTAAPDNGGKS